MRILYVARHDQFSSADDEGAITHALVRLGHDVQRVREPFGKHAHKVDADFCLFHHWADFESLRKIRCPKVFWCFDLIHYPDPLLHRRCQARKNWITEALRIVDLGFCTDGNFCVNSGPYVQSSKLVWLTQGADERVVGRGAEVEKDIDILFTGIGKGGGAGREAFVADMSGIYGYRFLHVSRGVYGRDLADLIARAKIVVAPPVPVFLYYWSNRVYNTLGFGGFLLHPECSVVGQYSNGLVVYNGMTELHDKIKLYLEASESREAISEAGLQETMAGNLYRHRCEELVCTVEKRLKI